MNELAETKVACPYCGETIVVLIDAQDAGQRYIEDCQVCCRPISFSIAQDFEGELTVAVRDENDAC